MIGIAVTAQAVGVVVASRPPGSGAEAEPTYVTGYDGDTITDDNGNSWVVDN